MLTKEQIEVERISYEAYRRKENPQWSGYRDEFGQYVDIVNWSGFNAWLALVELRQDKPKPLSCSESEKPFEWVVKSLNKKELHKERDAVNLLLSLYKNAVHSYQFEIARRTEYENKFNNAEMTACIKWMIEEAGFYTSAIELGSIHTFEGPRIEQIFRDFIAAKDKTETQTREPSARRSTDAKICLGEALPEFKQD